MPEAVDRLELVPDEEELVGSDQVDQLALEAVRVLELVDHHRAEAPRLALLDVLVLAEEIACRKLEILEVDPRLPLLRACVRAREALEQLLQEVAVARREHVQSRLLDRLPGGLVAFEPFPWPTARRELREVEQVLGLPVVLEHLEHPDRLRSLLVVPVFVDQTASRLAKGLDPLPERRSLAEAKVQRSAGGAERLVDAGQHPPEAVRAVGRRRRRTPRAPPRTPPREARAPGCRRGLESADRAPRRTDTS